MTQAFLQIFFKTIAIVGISAKKLFVVVVAAKLKVLKHLQFTTTNYLLYSMCMTTNENKTDMYFMSYGLGLLIIGLDKQNF